MAVVGYQHLPKNLVVEPRIPFGWAGFSSPELKVR